MKRKLNMDGEFMIKGYTRVREISLNAKMAGA
jgi:hypothetical protein